MKAPFTLQPPEPCVLCTLSLRVGLRAAIGTTSRWHYACVRQLGHTIQHPRPGAS